MFYNVKVIETQTGEVFDTLYQVEAHVARSLAKGYEFDPFYSVVISN